MDGSPLRDSPYLAEKTRIAIDSLFEALANKLKSFATSKQDFETAYYAATHAYRNDLREIISQATQDFLKNMPDFYKIGDAITDGEGYSTLINEQNILQKNEEHKRFQAVAYIRLPEFWKSDLRLLYVEAASKG